MKYPKYIRYHRTRRDPNWKYAKVEKTITNGSNFPLVYNGQRVAWPHEDVYEITEAEYLAATVLES